MSTHKEFEGKSLDDAIQDACNYYGVEREKLEVEIINDAKAGIFGLMGMKKARIRAARMQPLASSLFEKEDEDEAASVGPGNSLAVPPPPTPRQRSYAPRDKALDAQVSAESRSKTPEAPVAAEARNKAHTTPAAGEHRGKRPAPGKAVGSTELAKPEPGNTDSEAQDTEKNKNRTPRKNVSRSEAPSRPQQGTRPHREKDTTERRGNRSLSTSTAETSNRSSFPTQGSGRSAEERESSLSCEAGFGDELREDLPELSLTLCDKEKVIAVVTETVLRLVQPIVGDVPCVIEIQEDRVRATVDCGEDSGLLVGREGQTLAAVQYLAGRIVGRLLGGSIRLQVDAGNYRERQDDRLKEIALALAVKAKASKRTQSTRPLSAYQRRIIHLALENDPQIQTSSKGEGLQRRVIIQLRRQRIASEADTQPTDEEAVPEHEPSA